MFQTEREEVSVDKLPLCQGNNELNFDELFSDGAFRNTHAYWVKSLAIKLFTVFSGKPLDQVAETQTQFSTVMVPLLIKVVLTTKNRKYYRTLSNAISLFFTKTFEKLEQIEKQVHD